LTKPTQHSEAQ